MTGHQLLTLLCCLHHLAVSLPAQPYPLRSGEEPPRHDVKLQEIKNLSAVLREMRSELAENKIDPRSFEFALLTKLQSNPDVAATAIPELIELSNVLQPKPFGTENFSPFILSPAAQVLVVIGGRAEAPIRQKLDTGKPDYQWQGILEKTLTTIAKIEANRAEKAVKQQRAGLPAFGTPKAVTDVPGDAKPPKYTQPVDPDPKYQSTPKKESVVAAQTQPSSTSVMARSWPWLAAVSCLLGGILWVVIRKRRLG